MDKTEYVAKVLHWNELHKMLTRLKIEENDLRRELAEGILQGRTGTYHFKVDDLKISAVGKISTNVDSAALNAIWKNLTIEEKDSIKFKPEIISKKYKELPADSKLSQVVTTKPAMPSLKVVEV